MNRFRVFFGFFTLFLLGAYCHADGNYLVKPTGEYGVGYKDYFWVNNLYCPDFNYTGKNKSDFSEGNKKYCHEIVVRVYYPIHGKHYTVSPYYVPSINLIKNAILQSHPKASEKQLAPLMRLQSFSIENETAITGHRFPVLVFISGLGSPVQSEENFITSLVSQGYFVIGMNSPFINEVALASGHEIKAKASNTYSNNEMQWVRLQESDLSVVYQKIFKLQKNDPLFSKMNLKRIGIFGVSLGGRVLANTIHNHPNWFQAAVALDTAEDNTNLSFEAFSIPYMHIISPKRRLFMSGLRALQFILGDNGYIVGLAQSNNNLQDFGFMSHQNFDDLATIQYIPVIQDIFNAHDEQIKNEKLNVLYFYKPLTKNEINLIEKPTYVFVQSQHQWILSLYANKQKIININLDLIPKLKNILKQHGPSTTVSIYEKKKIESVVYEINQLWEGLATGNGFEVTKIINNYLATFFNHYIKMESEEYLKTCTPLMKDSYIQCGPGKFN